MCVCVCVYVCYPNDPMWNRVKIECYSISVTRNRTAEKIGEMEKKIGNCIVMQIRKLSSLDQNFAISPWHLVLCIYSVFYRILQY